MKLSGDGKLMRIFLGEQDHYKQMPFYEAIVREARERGLAGATVFRGVMGFGAGSRVIHTAKILRLSEDLPFIVEIVDTEERVNDFLPVVERMFEEVGCGGLITIEKAQVIMYQPGK